MIQIQNIYYMLSYAFQTLKEDRYKDIATEEFHNTADLLAEILIRGITSQIKRGLGRDYLLEEEQLSTLRGKINITDSLKTQSLMKKQLICSYDSFSVDTYMNQVIKATVQVLLNVDINKSRKKKLRNLMMYFGEVSHIDVHRIDWKFRYTKNNKTYQLLMVICELIIKGLIQTNSNGSVSIMNYLDEQRMCRLYEKFILEYYRQEHPELEAAPSRINWQLDDGFSEMLPAMQTDITLSKNNNILIIDAKYYSHSTQEQYGIHTLHSANLYQIFTYVKNKDAEMADKGCTVSGMLLYAKTDEEIFPNQTYKMSGNKISAKVLDLSKDFSEIRKQLDLFAEDNLCGV